MLSLWFGKDGFSKKNSDVWFDHNYEWEWFDDPFVKNMLREVEGTVYDENYNFTNPFRSHFTLKDIGGGIKTVILMKHFKREGLYFNLVCCGENLAPYIAELSLIEDLNVRCTLSGPYMSFKENTRINILCENNGEVMLTDKDFIRNKLQYLSSSRNMENYMKKI